jgi:hypothetical protein
MPRVVSSSGYCSPLNRGRTHLPLHSFLVSGTPKNPPSPLHSFLIARILLPKREEEKDKPDEGLKPSRSKSRRPPDEENDHRLSLSSSYPCLRPEDVCTSSEWTLVPRESSLFFRLMSGMHSLYSRRHPALMGNGLSRSCTGRATRNGRGRRGGRSGRSRFASGQRQKTGRHSQRADK